jgi:DNA-binding transcriptional LysR family regulator
MVQMVRDISNDQRGELRVGISHTCGRAILPSILPGFRRAHPLIDIVIREDNSEAMEYALQRGKLDLMIDFSPILLDGIQYKKLIEERLFLVVPKELLHIYYGACCDAVRSECDRNLDLNLFRQFPFLLLKKGNRVRKMVDHYMRKIDFTPNYTGNGEHGNRLCTGSAGDGDNGLSGAVPMVHPGGGLRVRSGGVFSFS